MDFKNYIRDINDFPKQGIVFKDITPLLKDARAFKATTKALVRLVTGRIDKVVGIESRGFFFAPLMALQLNAGFVPVRKKGKLPADILGHTYTLEYGNDDVEIHVDSIQQGDKVLIHDDVLATGGTAHAVCQLIEKLGGEVVFCHFLIELDFLKGRQKLSNYQVKALLHY